MYYEVCASPFRPSLVNNTSRAISNSFHIETGIRIIANDCKMNVSLFFSF